MQQGVLGEKATLGRQFLSSEKSHNVKWRGAELIFLQSSGMLLPKLSDATPRCRLLLSPSKGLQRGARL